MSKTEEYLAKQKAADLQVGDKVKVIRTAKDNEQGWDNTWVEEMDRKPYKIGTIKRDKGVQGFEVSFGDMMDFDYPYFVLEKVE